MKMPIDSEELNTLLQNRIALFQRSLLKSIVEYTGYKNALKLLLIDYKTFERTDNTVLEIRCCDKVIAMVYTARTEFNHQEVIFMAFTDVFPYIKKQTKELSKLI